MSEFSDRLLALVSPYVQLAPEQVATLEHHFQILTRWNAKLNLTAIRDPDEAVRRHYAECLWFAAELRRFNEETLHIEHPHVADVGSGAGFPGIPIAVVSPRWSLTLIESHHRKAVFLSEATRELSNVRVLARRVEEVDDRFDVAVSRAVDPVTVLKLGLASTFALLIGINDVPRGTSARILPLPWSQNRVAMFHVEPRAR